MTSCRRLFLTRTEEVGQEGDISLIPLCLNNEAKDEALVIRLVSNFHMRIEDYVPKKTRG